MLLSFDRIKLNLVPDMLDELEEMRSSLFDALRVLSEDARLKTKLSSLTMSSDLKATHVQKGGSLIQHSKK